MQIDSDQSPAVEKSSFAYTLVLRIDFQRHFE